MQQRERSPLGGYMIGIAALFLAGFLLLVIFGAGIYRHISAGQRENYTTRSLASYISTCVKANDTAGGVRKESSPYGDVLVVTEGSTGYAFRIYRYEGELVEDFARAEAPLAPESAQVIGATELYTVEYAAEDLLAVTTDAGRTMIHLRSQGGGEGA